MIKKVYTYLSTHGTVLMIIGFLLAVISLVVYTQTRYYGSAIPQVAFGCTIAGFVIYVLGRIFVAIERQRSRSLNDRRS